MRSCGKRFTGRDKIIKFKGCYHGHSDGLLVQAGSAALTQSVRTAAEFLLLLHRRL